MPDTYDNTGSTAAYASKMPNINNDADIQEAIQAYHYGDPVNATAGSFTSSWTDPATGVLGKLLYLNDAKINKSTLSAKGGLISATAASTPSMLSVGTNGFVLKANSSTSTGLEWYSLDTTHLNLDPSSQTLVGNLTLSKASPVLTVNATSGPAELALNTTGAGYSNIWLQTSTEARWVITKDNTPETGTDAGSDFAIYRYSDTEAYLGVPLSIARSSGLTTLTSLTVSGATSVSTLTASSTGSFTGKLTTAASASGNAGFILTPGAAPSAPVNGDLWLTSAGIYARIAGDTYPLAIVADGPGGLNGSNVTSGIVAGQYGGTGVANTGKTITLGGSLTTSGAYALTLTLTGATNVTLPTSGTLAIVGNPLSQFASTTSAQLAGVISDETGSDKLVFNTSPSFITSVTTSSSTFAVFNTTASTVDAFGAATTLNLGAATGTTTIANNLTVSGNLTINGTTTTTNSTTVTIDDPIFTLGGDSAPGADDNKDRGIEFRWHNGSTAKIGFFGYDDSTGKLTFIPDATNTSEVFSGTKGSIDAYFSGSDINTGTVAVAYGGTGVSTSTGSINVVLSESPTLTGTPRATTAAVDTNTTQLATTAYVINQGYLKSSTASSTYQPVDADLTAIAALAGTTGLLKKTAANTWTLDTAAYSTTTGTVTSVGITVPTGLSVTPSSITTSGTFAVSLAGGYEIPTTAALAAKAPLTSPSFVTSVTTSSTTFAVFDTTATTINAFGAATAINIGSGTATISVPSTVDATDYQHGSIKTAGGVGIAKDLQVHGNIGVHGGIISGGIVYGTNFTNTTGTLRMHQRTATGTTQDFGGETLWVDLTWAGWNAYGTMEDLNTAGINPYVSGVCGDGSTPGTQVFGAPLFSQFVFTSSKWYVYFRFGTWSSAHNARVNYVLSW